MKSKSSKPLSGERASPERAGRVPLPGQRLSTSVGSKVDGISAANSEGVEHLHIHGDDKQFAKELAAHVKGNFNPLLHGMKNVGKNIGVEIKSGKPRKQAIAIAYAVARGKKDYH